MHLCVRKNSETSNSTGATVEAISATATNISSFSTSTTLKFYRAHDSKVPSSGHDVSSVTNKQILSNRNVNSGSGDKKTSKKDKSNLMNKLKVLRMKIKKK